MVRVWEQQYPGGDVTYIDESGATHVEGAQHRQTMPDAYPLPSTAPAGVTRKTPRGRKVPRQGRGSIKQGPWRECFKKCTIRWSTLPDECPWNAECPPTSSKKNVWDAKQAQGVMCAYYDLYIACCLSSCEQITVIGPKGKPIVRGTIPAENCFPCDNPSTGKTLSIAFWSQQMSVNGYQMLSAYDSVHGYSIPFCGDEQLHWRVKSGGGTLSVPYGTSSEYHAPEANENCVQNPVIELEDCCGRKATLALAVNAVASWLYYAHQQCVFSHCEHGGEVDPGFEVAWGWVTREYCDGTILAPTAVQDGIYYNPGGCAASMADMLSCPSCAPEDMRTEAQKTEGCCPYQLL